MFSELHQLSKLIWQK